MSKRLAAAIFAALALTGAVAVPASADVTVCYYVSLTVNGQGQTASDCHTADTP